MIKLYTSDGKFIGTKPPDYIDNEGYTGMIEYSDGDRCWYKKGFYYRLDGPAYEGADGTKSWFFGNRKVTEEQYNLIIDLMKLKGLL